MNLDIEQLPDDPKELKLLLTQLNEKYENQLEEYLHLEEKYKSLQRLLFGKKSEKLTKEDENQMILFNEAEDGSEDIVESDEQTESETTNVKAHARKKGGKKRLPEHLHREEIIHEFTDDERLCECCGKERPIIGEEITEELDIIPQKIIVNKHIRKKLGPCECNEFLHKEILEVKTAQMPPRLIPYSIASPGLVAYTVTAKFCDHLPFYRQSKIFDRLDIDIPRATLCNWALLAAKKCMPLIDIMIEEIQGGPVIRMDETTLKVLKEPGRKAESTSYMWIVMGYTDLGKPLLLYQYHPTRSGDVPKKFLENYKGILQTDGYGGYNRAVQNTEIIHAGCFAHARRYFEKAWKLNKKSKTAFMGLDYIKKIYAIENELRDKNYEPNIFVEKRKNAVTPILDAFHNWLLSQKNSVVPKSKLGEAINYSLSEWHKLIKYLDHHLLTPDNNLIENAIRPFVLGRKNWLFNNTPRGAEASAVLYSLIETAKANKLEPYKYLRYLFNKLPSTQSKEDMRSLLPDKITPEMIQIY